MKIELNTEKKVSPCAMSTVSGEKKKKVVLGLTGSVASIKAAELVTALCEFAEVRVVTTKAASVFVDVTALPIALEHVYGDEDEWRSWKKIGDPVLHIELRRWADAFVVAPLSANTLAKMANGLCDNLLTCVVRAWDFSKPLVVAPAMNTAMWVSPFTAKHLDKLSELGVHVIQPVSKTLACGDVGVGAMAPVRDVKEAVAAALT